MWILFEFVKFTINVQIHSLLFFYTAVQLGSASFYQCAVHFLCEDPHWACQVWPHLSGGSTVIRLSLVTWVKEGRGWRGSHLQQELEKALQVNKSPLAVSSGGLYRVSVPCDELSSLLYVFFPYSL